MAEVQHPLPRMYGALIGATVASLVLYIGGRIMNQDATYSFMVWNLFLAWIPLLLVLWLLRMLRRKRWSSWQGIALSFVWLGFLPNSFYMISDYIHINEYLRVDVLYDTVMLTSFVFTGLLLGYLSLYIFHVELRKRLSARGTFVAVAGILFLCSLAIYLGRDLRWNTWDLFVNPAGILFDVSDRLINPRAHPGTFTTILSFFLLLSMMYWAILRLIRPPARNSSGG